MAGRYADRRRGGGTAALLLCALAAAGAGAAIALHGSASTGGAGASAGASAGAASSAPAPSAGPPPSSSSRAARTSRSATSASPRPVFDTSAHSTTDPASPWVVVNKQHPITPVDYAPASLATVGGKQVSAQVVPDLDALVSAASAAGVHLVLVSGYRSYAYQVQVHDASVAREGEAASDALSARPGYSEHQTGFAVDFSGTSDPACQLEACFADTTEGRWLAANAVTYGFVLRYTAADSPVTGYSPEAWHFRWVGRPLAAEMQRRGVATLEQFFGVTGGATYAPLPSAG